MILPLLLTGSCFIEVLLEDSFGADVFGFVVAFVDSEVVLSGELVFAVVGVLVFFGFEIADALS